MKKVTKATIGYMRREFKKGTSQVQIAKALFEDNYRTVWGKPISSAYVSRYINKGTIVFNKRKTTSEEPARATTVKAEAPFTKQIITTKSLTDAQKIRVLSALLEANA